MRQGGLSEECQRFVEVRECRNVGHALDAVDGIGGDSHGAHSFFVAFVADVDDSETLTDANPNLVVHLGDQRAYRVHGEAAGCLCVGNDIGGGAVCAQHDGRTLGHLVDAVDEDDTLLLEAANDLLVVHDLVVAVHRRRERAHHGGQRLDRHLYACAEPSGRCQQNLICRHPLRLPKSYVPLGR